MRIRQFTLDDYEAAVRLWDVAEGMSAPDRREVERKLERDPQLFLVAEDESFPARLIGVVVGTYDGRRGWIFRLAVVPEHRRRGVGRALVRELEDRFLDMGVRRIRLLTVTDNLPARRFWEALGYRGFEDVVLFSRELGGATALPTDGSCDC